MKIKIIAKTVSANSQSINISTWLERDLEESEYIQLQKFQQQELAEHFQQLEQQWAENEAGIAQ